MSKQYGLILPGKNNKQAPTFSASRNVFGDDSNSDDEKEKKQPLLRPSTKVRKQDKQVQEKALFEDPTVFQYDEVYEDMETKKKEKITSVKVEKKPRYIERLLESANKRKRENERRMERQVQKEREKEGDEFADKESFVTNAYKQKLDELRAEEEREKREEYLEKIGDVTKQQDLGGFYRHLYEQKLGKEDKNNKSNDEDVKKEDINPKIDNEKAEKDKNKNPPKKQRNYRKRKSSNELLHRELSEGEILSEEETKLSLEDIKASKKSRQENKVDNVDADSDFKTESSESEDDAEKGNKHDRKSKQTNSTSEAEKQDFKKPVLKEKPSEEANAENAKVTNEDNLKENSPPKPKVNIWAKRTVGVVFDEALKRYYERKAARCR